MYLNVLDNRLKIYMEKKINPNKKKILLVLFIINVLNIGDIITTYIGLHILGLKEINPLMQMLYNDYYFFSIAIFKFIFFIISSGFLYLGVIHYKQNKWIYPIYVTYFMLFITVANNIMQIILK